MFIKILEISGHAGAVYTGAVDQNFLYSGSADRYVTRWNIETGEQDKFAIKMDQSVYALEFISENRTYKKYLFYNCSKIINIKQL